MLRATVSRLTPSEAAAPSIPTPEASFAANFASATVRPNAAHNYRFRPQRRRQIGQAVAVGSLEHPQPSLPRRYTAALPDVRLTPPLHHASRRSRQPGALGTATALVTRPCRRRCSHSGARSGAEEVVVDVFFSLVAEERDDVLELRVPSLGSPGGDEMRAGTRAHEQPKVAGPAAHLADRRVAVHRDYLVDAAQAQFGRPGVRVAPQAAASP